MKDTFKDQTDLAMVGLMQVHQGLWHMVSNLEGPQNLKKTKKHLYLRSKFITKCPFLVGKKSERHQFCCQLCIIHR